MSRVVVAGDLRHLHEVQLHNPFYDLRRKGRGRAVWARLGEAWLYEPRRGGSVAGVAGAGGALDAAAASSNGVRPARPGTVGVNVGSVGRGRPGVGPGGGGNIYIPD